MSVMSDIANVLNVVMVGLKYTPYVLGAVQAVEESNASLPGATKKNIVMAAIVAAAKVGEQVPETHVQIISTLIDEMVATLNAAGIFKTSKVAQTA